MIWRVICEFFFSQNLSVGIANFAKISEFIVFCLWKSYECFRCNDICGKYRYDCKFHGIGDGPADAQSLGSCSQAAVFTRVGEKPQINSNVEEETYSLVNPKYI